MLTLTSSCRTATPIEPLVSPPPPIEEVELLRELHFDFPNPDAHTTLRPGERVYTEEFGVWLDNFAAECVAHTEYQHRFWRDREGEWSSALQKCSKRHDAANQTALEASSRVPWWESGAAFVGGVLVGILAGAI